jgi:Na+-transporting methylmalonyl-CoA/oxaloacetate decarboxylase gamma subunit
MIVTTMILIMNFVMIMSFIFIVSVIIKAVAPQHNTKLRHKHSSWRNDQLIEATNSRTHRATTAIAAAVAEISASSTDAVVLAKERRDEDDARRRQTATRGRRADFPGVRGFCFFSGSPI